MWRRGRLNNNPTSEREDKVGQEGEGDWDVGTGVACETRNGHWEDEHGVYHLKKAEEGPRRLGQ
jgi:hypothetical protein